jgi:hypothetical protein
MCEERAMYQADALEWRARVDAMQARLDLCAIQRDRMEDRIRQLEDAILLHARAVGSNRTADMLLHDTVAHELWT